MYLCIYVSRQVKDLENWRFTESSPLLSHNSSIYRIKQYAMRRLNPSIANPILSAGYPLSIYQVG